MTIGFFTANQSLFLVIGGLLISSSVFLFQKRPKISLLLLFLGTLAIGFFMAILDPFLNMWDEQFHALVAKNIANNSLIPTLYNEPLFDYDYRKWDRNHIWLHKPPLFLWQIALSIELFGANEVAVRIPSIILHALIPLFIYRIGSISVNKTTGFYGAVLFSSAHFPLELLIGYYFTDHNDIAFLFYVTASFWALFEYQESRKIKWLILIGLFSGCAILVKWLMGLLVYVVWGFSKIITEHKNLLKVNTWWPMLTSLVISSAIFVPWLVFIRISYPMEYAYESSMRARRFNEAIETHGGDFTYHFTEAMQSMYGSSFLVPIIILFGFVLILFRAKNTLYKIFIATSVIFIYGFFSIAATKMIAYTLIAAPFLFLGMATVIDSIIKLSEQKINVKLISQFFRIGIPLVSAYLLLNLVSIQELHTPKNINDNPGRISKLRERQLIQKLKTDFHGENYVLFNAHFISQSNISIMFYTDIVAYNFIPSPKQLSSMQEIGKKVAILDKNEIPDYIRDDPKITLVNLEEWQ